MDLTAMSPAPLAVKDVSTKDFLIEVIEGSRDKPVVVDFWAPWCGPCKTLGPILEKNIANTNGAVRMVKVDIDQNQQLAAQMGIQSIPAVFAFYKGQPVDGFMGNQPESTVKSWVDRLAKLAGGAVGQSPVEEALSAAEEMLSEGQAAEAQAVYAQILQHDDHCAAAYAGLARAALALNDPEQAREILAEVPADLQDAKELQPVRTQLDLLAQAATLGGVGELEAAVTAAPDNHEKRLELAQALHAKGRSGEAIDHLLESIKRDRKWNEEAARKQLVTLFEALGYSHELSVEGRRKLSSVLFK